MLLYFINAYFIQPDQTQRQVDVTADWVRANPTLALGANDTPWENDGQWRQKAKAVAVMNFLVLVFSVPVVVPAGLTPSKQSNTTGGSSSNNSTSFVSL